MVKQQYGNPKANESSSESTHPSSSPVKDPAEVFHSNFPGTPTLVPELNKTPNTPGASSQTMRQDKDDDRNPAKSYFKAVKDAVAALRQVEMASKSLVIDHKSLNRQRNDDTGKVQGKNRLGVHFRRADPAIELQVSLRKANDSDLAWSLMKRSRWELGFAQVKSTVRVHGFFKATVALAKAFWSVGTEVRGQWVAAAAVKTLTISGFLIMVVYVAMCLSDRFLWVFETAVEDHFLPNTFRMTRLVLKGFWALCGAWMLNAGFALLFPFVLSAAHELRWSRL